MAILLLIPLHSNYTLPYFKNETMTKQHVIKTISLAMLIATTSIFQACKKSSDSAVTSTTGDWERKATFSGYDRSSAVAFEINGLGYLGTGFDGSNRLNDFWVYNPATNGWEQKANVPGSARSEAIGFSVMGKGYVGLGQNGTTLFKDFYEYDPSANTWTAKADFGSTARYGAVAFAIGNYGYVGTGYDGTKNDFYKYDPSADAWSSIISFAGEKRVGGVAFVADGNAYVGTGTYNGVYQKDFYQYSPTTGLWTAMQSLENGADLKRTGAAAFSISGKGYIATGTYNNTVQTNTWEFTPPTTAGGIGSWSQKGDFEGVARTGAVGLTIGNAGFVLTGKNGNARYGDMWELKPNNAQVR
jgi:N-acetylneuraminic acid mutarotase